MTQTTKTKSPKKKDSDSQEQPKTQIFKVNKKEAMPLNEVDIERIDREVLDGMGSTNRARLTRCSPDSLTLRQMQAAGAEFLASLVGHPEIRKGTISAAIKDPLAILKIASSERPKEIHLEAEVQHSVVVVPAQQTPEEWDASVKVIEGVVIKDEPW